MAERCMTPLQIAAENVRRGNYELAIAQIELADERYDGMQRAASFAAPHPVESGDYKAGPRRANDRAHGNEGMSSMHSDPIAHQRRVYAELRRAPTVGLTRGELAILLIDLDDDCVSAALGAEVNAGRVITSERDDLVRYHPCDNGTQP